MHDEDRAVWVTWYNLPEQGREAYFDWLHGSHIPRLLERPGYLWAAHYASLPHGDKVPRRHGKKFNTDDPSVPAGDRFIFIIGGRDAGVFGDPPPSVLRGQLPENDRKMLALRQGERINVMIDCARVQGPAGPAYKRGMNPPPCIQMGSFNCALEDEEDVLRWYAQWRLPAMRTLEGCVRARLLASVYGWAKHSVFYEFETLEARNHFLRSHEDGDENRAWTDKVIASLMHAPGSANVAQRIWPPVSAEEARARAQSQ